MLKVLDRYIVLELVKPFIVGVLGFMVLLVGNTLFLFADLLVHSKVPAKEVGKLLLYSLPADLVVAFPVAYMFSTLLVIGRLTKDSELTAMRSVGVSFNRIIFPILMVAVVVSYMGFCVNDMLVPWANRKTVDLVRDIMLHQSQPILKDNIFFRGNRENRYFYIRQVDRRSNQMFDVFIDDNRGGNRVVITAREATWVGKTWQMRQGIVHTYDKTGALLEEKPFREMSTTVSSDPKVFFESGERSPQEKASEELWAEIETLRTAGSDTKGMEVDYYLKFSLPLATFFSTLLAAPLGAKFSRMGAYIGVVFTIILVFIYHLVMSVAHSMGANGVVEPFWGAWIQNVIFGIVGVIFLWRIDR